MYGQSGNVHPLRRVEEIGDLRQHIQRQSESDIEQQSRYDDRAEQAFFDCREESEDDRRQETNSHHDQSDHKAGHVGERRVTRRIQIGFKPHREGQLEHDLQLSLLRGRLQCDGVVAVADILRRIELVIIDLFAVEKDLDRREIGDEHKVACLIRWLQRFCEINIAFFSFRYDRVLRVIDTQLTVGHGSRLFGIQIVPVGKAVLIRIAVGDIVRDKVDRNGQQKDDQRYAQKGENSPFCEFFIQFFKADLFHFLRSIEYNLLSYRNSKAR